MRKLWEDHITWTRLAIVTFADGSASFPATADRLLPNQRDIGDAIAPFYGQAARELHGQWSCLQTTETARTGFSATVAAHLLSL